MTGRYHHGDLRAALLNAARAAVDEHGHEDLSLRALARTLNVSHTAPQRHFDGILALLAAVAARGYDELRAAMQLPPGAPPLARMRQVGVGYLEFALSHPRLFRLLYDPKLASVRHVEGLDLAAKRTFDHVAQTVADCQAVGVIRADEPETALARFAWSAVHGAAVLALDGQLDAAGGFDASRFAMEITTSIFRGLRM